MNTTGKVVWVLQWVALVATPLWWTFGSAFTGGGWGTLVLMIAAVPTFLLMLIGPIVGIASRRYRAAKQMPAAYSRITPVQWILGAVWPLTITSQGDSNSGPSALGAIGIPEAVVAVIGAISAVGFFLALVGGLVSLLVAGSLPTRSES
jgi:hypothetical protein